MKRTKNNVTRWILFAFLLALTTFSFAWIYNRNATDSFFPKDTASFHIDEKADQLMKEMSNSLKSLDQFKLQSKGYFEVIDSTGKKVRYDNSGQIFVKRPDKIKVLRSGEKTDLEFYCDGNKIALYGKKTKYYATSDATQTLNETFDKIKDRLNIELPATDLLYTDVYDGLMQDVMSGKYIGKEMAGGTKCEHLYFTGKEIDWEIWIEDSDRKLPRKYVIISKDLEGMPKSSIEISDWDIKEKFEDKMFTFVPPKGAMQIQFLELNEDSQTKK